MPRSSLHLLLLASLFAPGTALPPASASSDGEADLAVHRALERETASRRAELELVRSMGFYVKLDARRSRLSLMLKGVPLEELELERFETGVPRVLFRRRRPPADWDLRAFTDGRLEPARERDRIEIVAPAPSPTGDEAAVEPSPPALPPTAEEAYSVPSRYRIVFEEGPTLEITSEGGGRNRGVLQRAGDALALRAADVWGGVRASGPGRVRLRLRLSAEDADALYRSLPPDVGLLVVGLSSP